MMRFYALNVDRNFSAVLKPIELSLLWFFLTILTIVNNNWFECNCETAVGMYLQVRSKMFAMNTCYL